MSDINKQMAEFAKELWENYIKPKVGIEFSDTVSYYMATVVSNDGYNRVTIKRPFDDAYQVSCLDDMAGLEAGDTVLVLRFGNGPNNANHIVFGKGNGNMNYTAAAATATATEASVAAGQAAEAAADAIESAGQAASAAESAQQSAQAAQQSADTANQAANNALIGLATVEGVVDTVNWFAEHKTASTDTSVVPSKTYYEYNPVAGTLSAVTPEGDENPSQEGWYELSEAISNYVATHIATTNDGLYVVGLSNGWKVLVSSGAGTYTAGIFLIDPSGNIAQATTANGITFDDSKPFYIGDNNASIVFDGNGHISISGIGVSIGSTGSKSINEILTELGASIKTIEYGVGNSATSHSDITSWSSNTPEWQEDKYIWQRTTTNGLTYTYTCIQGAAGAPGAPGVSVSGVTNYYLATSQSSGVTRETTGWTTSIQTMTSTNQYLWNYEVVTGSDGSTLNTTDPVIIGRYGQDGGSGRGITGITEYYLASNQQTGITPSSSGWTTTVQTTTTATPYLWNYEVVTYSSGSPETSSARIIGTHGATGADGRMLYATSTTAAGTAAKTATLANGTLTLTAGATVAVTFTYANTAANPTLNVAGTGAKAIRAGGASLTATSEYNWTAGATAIFVYDGTYWQMDGTAALDKLGSLEIGGRNLLISYDALPVADRLISVDTSYTYDPDTGTYVVKQTATSSGFLQIYTLDGVTDATQLAGKEVTLSARSITSTRAAAEPRFYIYVTKSDSDIYSISINKNNLKTTFTLPSNTVKIGYLIRIDQNKAGSTGETATFTGVKLELGNMATDWTPAPEDTLAEIANVEVGGRNLSTGTGTAKTLTPASTKTWFTPIGFYPIGDYGISLIRNASTLDEWVLSFDYVITGATVATQFLPDLNYTATSYAQISSDRIDVPIGDSSGHFSTVFTMTAEQITYGSKWLLGRSDNTDDAVSVTLSNFMFEKGNRASSWSPAPEDVAEAIASVEDTATEALNKHGFCSCSTAAGTAAKAATLSGFQLKTGSTVHVTFTNANSVANPTLNINSTGAKTIRWNNANVTAATSPWAAGECVTFVYDGTYWVVSGQSNITADNIVAGSIAADRIKANVISAVNGGTGTIDADKVNAAGLTIGQSQVTGLTAALDGKEAAVADATSTYDTSQTPYFIRQASKAIMGQESLDKIVGGSLGWNQMIPYTASTGTSAGITFTNNNNGSWTITGTGTNNNAFLNLDAVSGQNKFIANHVYCIIPNQSGATTFTKVGLRVYGLKATASPYETYIPYIVKCVASPTETGYTRMQVTDANGINIGTVKLTPQVFDLTQMFGSAVADYIVGLGQTDGLAWLSPYIDFSTYHAYDSGSIQSVQATEHITTGKNYFNPTVGKYVNNDGTITATGNAYWCVDKFFPTGNATEITGKIYNSSSGYTGSCGCAFFDGAMTFISSTNFFTASGITSYPFTKTLTVPSGAKYFGIRGYQSGGASAILSAMVQIEMGASATAYEPYTKHSYPLDSTLTLRGVPKLVSNELQFDGDVYLPSGSVTRKYGIVNLGSLTWTYNSSTATPIFSASLSSLPKACKSNSGQMVCPKYEAKYNFWNTAGNDKMVGSGTSNLNISDSAYTNATTFKTAMSGVYLVYPLATETTESSSPYQQVQMADPNGTEGFTTTSLVPVGHYTTYPTNLRAAIDSLPVDTTDAARTATNYITNINSGGITVTGNSATSNVQISNKVRVQADSTHFTDVESTGMKVYAGSSSTPVAQFLANSSRVGSDSTHYTEFTSNSLTIEGGTDSPTVQLSTYPITSSSVATSAGRIRVTNKDRTKDLITLHTQAATNSGVSWESANLWLSAYDTGNSVIGLQTARLTNGSTAGGTIYINGLGTTNRAVDLLNSVVTINNTQVAGGSMRVHYGTASVAPAIEIGAYTMNSSPTVKFMDTSGTTASWYGIKSAYIKDGTHQGYVVHGETAVHGITIDYLTSGRINFYVDTTSIGYATITSSDERMKTDIKPIDERYKDAIKNIELKNFHFDFDDPTRAGANLLERFGAVAQDVIAAFEDEGLDWEDSEIVETLKDDDGEYYVINYVPFLVARLAADEDRIKELEDKNAELEARLAAIEAKLGL